VTGNLRQAGRLIAAGAAPDDEALAALAAQRHEWRLRTVAALADLVLAVHWSVRKSPISPLTVALCGSLSSLIGFHLKWKATSA